MSETNEVCYTFEAALEMAIEMERNGFRHYLDAIRILKNKGAREVMRDAALDELEHKHILEKALLDGRLDVSGAMGKPVPTMNLGYVLARKPLHPESDVREALTYAIHLEKESVDFYKRFSTGCAGAPMGNVFGKLLEDETRHLQALEDMYEEHFLPEG